MVIFRRGEATWWELERWEALIGSELYNLWDLGVQIMSVGKTADATIAITILDIDRARAPLASVSFSIPVYD